MDAPEMKRIGLLISTRRKAAGMSRPELARRCGVSTSTVKNIEAGRHMPSPVTQTALLGIPELQLKASDLKEGAADAAPMNCWISPGFDPLAMVHDLTARLAGRGGTIEQSFLYLDSKSAACWFSIANQAHYASTRDLNYIHAVAEWVRSLRGEGGLDVIGLGCGDGRKEVRLMHLLLAGVEPGQLSLYLLDISQPLLGYAFNAAVETLPASTSVFAIQGNFHHLPFYLQGVERLPRQRLLCMFGGTFGNLENEVRFVRNNLVGLQRGDLLLLHVGRVYAPADRPDQVHRLDPQLAGTVPRELRELEREWLTGPFERFGRAVGAPLPELEVVATLDTTSCPVPGSYAIEKSVLVRQGAEEPRRFTVAHMRRYDATGLAACMAELGWERIQIWDKELGNCLLALFRRL